MENVRAGTVAAAVYNSLRQKRTDRVWTWKDIFPDTTPKQPAVAGGDETTMQRNSTDIRWDGNDTWR